MPTDAGRDPARDAARQYKPPARGGKLIQDLKKVCDVGRPGCLAGEVDVRGLMEDLVADLNADARLAGDADAAVIDALAFEQPAGNVVIVGAQEPGDRGGVALVGQERRDVDPLSARVHL